MGFLRRILTNTLGHVVRSLLVLLIVVDSGAALAAEDAPLPLLDVLIFRDQRSAPDGASGANANARLLPAAVKSFLDASGLDYRARLIPWTRLALRGMKNDHTLIVNLLRTPRREHDFYWVLELDKTPLHLIGLKKFLGLEFSNMQIQTGTFRSICEAHSAQCSMFTDMGFPDDRILQVFGKTDGELAKLILAGRADFMIDKYHSLVKELKATGEPVEALVPLKKLPSAGTYLAAYKTLNAALLKQLQGED